MCVCGCRVWDLSNTGLKKCEVPAAVGEHMGFACAHMCVRNVLQPLVAVCGLRCCFSPAQVGLSGGNLGHLLPWRLEECLVPLGLSQCPGLSWR